MHGRTHTRTHTHMLRGDCAGGLETRTYGKRILFNIKSCQSKAEMDRLISSVHPAMLAKKV